MTRSALGMRLFFSGLSYDSHTKSCEVSGFCEASSQPSPDVRMHIFWRLAVS